MYDVEGLGHGIHRITLPLPFPSPRSVNCYAFEGDTGVTLLDCGVDRDEDFELLAGSLHAIGSDLGDLTRLVGSHLHVDHVAMARRLVETTDCEWVMHESTPTEIPHYNNWQARRVQLLELVRLHGGSPDDERAFAEDWPRPPWFSTAIPPTRPVADGDVISLGAGRTLRVIHTPGHHPTHICLVDSRTGLLFSGDHVLPRITPFVPYTGEDADHLGDYLASVERIEQLEAGLTFPAHGDAIDRGPARARQITLHHERRIGAMLQELRFGPRTAWEIMTATFRPNLPPIGLRLAFQETLAHLEHLRRRQQLERELIDGVFHYRRTR